MFGEKTNEREGTRAVLRHTRIAPNKVREVLNLVRDKPVHEAEDILRFSERDAAFVVGKVLHSAIANAENNDAQDPEELYVSACFADEGTTIKRWRPRARGRATRIRKRTSHVTVIVSRLPEDRLERLQAHRRAEQLAQRSRRVAGARDSDGDTRTRAERRRRGGPAEAPVEELDETTDATDTEAVDTTASETTDAETTESDATDAETTESDATETSAAEMAATADESGVVDTQALAVAESEAGEVTETAADTDRAEAIADTEAGGTAAAAEEAGIVDTTATAVAANEADGVDATADDKDEK
jgi:large subunit ribosomal protein L22